MLLVFQDLSAYERSRGESNALWLVGLMVCKESKSFSYLLMKRSSRSRNTGFCHWPQSLQLVYQMKRCSTFVRLNPVKFLLTFSVLLLEQYEDSSFRTVFLPFLSNSNFNLLNCTLLSPAHLIVSFRSAWAFSTSFVSFTVPYTLVPSARLDPDEGWHFRLRSLVII